MKVMVMVKATKNSEAGIMPSTDLLERMSRYNEELVKAGIMLAGDGLKPSSAAKRIRLFGAERTVIDGPFSESKELVAGYWIWQVKTIEEAVEWARRCPEPMPGEEGVLELRPLYELADFEPSLTPELRDRFERQDEAVARTGH